MSRRFICSASFALVCTVLLPGTPAGATQLLIPAYFEPGPYWTEMTAAAAGGASITAILNPDSGPGTAVDPTYTATVEAFEAAGGTVLGYVHTSDATRSPSAVEKDIKRYESFYPVNGFFLDQMTYTDGSPELTYYSGLYSYIKQQNAAFEVIGNPGTSVDSNYANLADTLVTYENVGSKFAANTAVSWSPGEPAGKFANIAYEVPNAATMLTDLAQAESQNVGYVYFTDDGIDGNPYDSLPSYFSAEVSAVPEPAGIALAGAAGLVLVRRRSK